LTGGSVQAVQNSGRSQSKDPIAVDHGRGPRAGSRGRGPPSGKRRVGFVVALILKTPKLLARGRIQTKNYFFVPGLGLSEKPVLRDTQGRETARQGHLPKLLGPIFGPRGEQARLA